MAARRVRPAVRPGPVRQGDADGLPETHDNRLDCGHDDYFSTNPKPGSYLATNWNVATSEFLLRSDGGDDIPDAPGARRPPPAPRRHDAAAAPTPRPRPAAPTRARDAGATRDGGGDAPPSPGYPERRQRPGVPNRTSPAHGPPGPSRRPGADRR